MLSRTSTPSSSARSAIRASPTTATPPTSCSGLRFGLDLYVNFRPVRLFHDRLCPLKGVAPKDVDFVVFRENTEGLYVKIGGHFKKDTPDEVATRGRQHAQGRRAHHPRGLRVRADARPHASVVHGRQVERARPRARALAARLRARWRPSTRTSRPRTSTSTPWRCRWCATRAVRGHRHENMFGDILTDLGGGAAGRAGHGGLARNIHPGRRWPVRAGARLGAALAGKDVANPMGAILTAGMMLEHLGWTEEAGRIEEAVRWAVENEHDVRHRRHARHARGGGSDRAAARDVSRRRRGGLDPAT